MITPPLHAHAMTVAEVLEHLKSSDAGLSTEEVERRLRSIGPNALPEKRATSTFWIIARQFQSPLIYLLLVAALLAVALGEWMDAVVIVAVVVVNSAIGAFQERRAERSMAALRRIASIKTRVLRSGRELQIDARELVPGDVILLAAGDAAPADARMLQGASVTVAEAVLTGESLPVSKAPEALPESTSLADRRNMLYAGTYLTGGRARAVVVATGPAAEVGKIAKLTEEAVEERTPLERRVAQFGKFLLIGGSGVFAAVLALPKSFSRCVVKAVATTRVAACSHRRSGRACSVPPSRWLRARYACSPWRSSTRLLP